MTTERKDEADELSRYLDALSASRRRYTLYYLQEQTTSNVSELAEYVLQCEADRAISEIPEEDHHSVQVDLYHNHLPHLDNASLVRFDERNKDVRMENTTMAFRGLLWICHTYENPP